MIDYIIWLSNQYRWSYFNLYNKFDPTWFHLSPPNRNWLLTEQAAIERECLDKNHGRSWEQLGNGQTRLRIGQMCMVYSCTDCKTSVKQELTPCNQIAEGVWWWISVRRSQDLFFTLALNTWLTDLRIMQHTLFQSTRFTSFRTSRRTGALCDPSHLAIPDACPFHFTA